MASPGLSEVVTTTLRNRSKTVADNFTTNTALMWRLSQKGKAKPFNGGRTVVHPIVYQRNGTYKRYSGYEQLNISPTDIFTAAEYSLKQAACAISISGLEMLQNSGSSQLVDLLEGRISNAEKTLYDEMAADLYSDGTADGGKQILGLQAIVADAGTGTVGGIDSSTYSFWANQFETVTTAFSSSNVQTEMNQLWLKLCRNRSKPDLIIADNLAYTAYWESLQSIQRITNTKMGAAGFENLKFMSADVVADGGYSDSRYTTGAPASHMYMLNTEHLFYRPHSQRNFVPLDPDRFSTNQDALVKLIGWCGVGLACDNRQLQGVIRIA